MINSRSGYLKPQLYQEDQISNTINTQNNYQSHSKQLSNRKIQNIFERSEKIKKAAKKMFFQFDRLFQKNFYSFLLQLSTTRKPIVLSKTLRVTQQRMMTPSKSPPHSNIRNRRYSSGMKTSSQQQKQPQLPKNLIQTSSVLREEYVRWLIQVIKKTNLVKKMHGFVGIKNKSENVKQYKMNILKFVESLKLIFKNQGKRLRKESFYKLISISHIDLNRKKSHLQKINAQTKKKCKLILPKVIKNLLIKKIHQNVTILLKFLNNTQRQANFNQFTSRLEIFTLKRYIFWGFKQLKKKLKNYYKLKKMMCLGYLPLKSIYLKKLKQGMNCIKNNLHLKKSFEQKVNIFKLIFQKILVKCKSGIFQKLKCHYRKDIPLFLNLSQIKQKNHKNLEELVDQQNQINYKQIFQNNQKLLKKTELQNTQLLQRLYQNQQILRKTKKQIRFCNDKIKQLQRDLRQKQITIKNLLSQQNKNIQYINKIKQQTKGKITMCECKNRFELAEFNQIHLKLSETLENLTENVENLESSCDNYYYNHLQYQLSNNLLNIFKDLLSNLQKDSFFKKEYILLNPIKSSLKQIQDINQKLAKKVEFGLEVEQYFFRKRTLCFMKDFKHEQMLRLTNNLFQKIRQQSQTQSTFKLFKVKLNEYCRNTQIVSRQFHKSLEKNVVMKNTLLKLEFNQNEIRNYMRILSHKSNKLSQCATNKQKQEEMLKILFLDFLENSISFNKKMLLKQKIADILKLNSHELAYIGITDGDYI